MKIPTVLLAVVAFGTLVSCTSSGQDKTPLRDADTITQAAPADDVAVGTRRALSDDIAATVTAMKVGGDDLGPWLEVSVKVENLANRELGAPDMGIKCGKAYEQDNFQAGSTIYPADNLPARSFKGGVVNLLLPGDSRTGEPVKACTGAAFVVVETAGAKRSLRYPIPATMVAAMNAKRQT